MNSVYQLERNLESELVKVRINKRLEQLGLKYFSKTSSNFTKVSHALLTNTKGDELNSGSGKGRNHTLGALAEAYEHFVFESECLKQKSFYFPVSVIAKQSEFAPDSRIHELNQTISSIVSAVEFKNLEHQSVWVPKSYIKHPELNDQQHANLVLQKYYSNTGTAVGSCLEEAYLHGVNEAIERHCLSLFILELMGYKTNLSWSNLSLTDKLNDDRLKYLAKKHKGQFVSLICQSPFKSYVAVSLFVPEAYDFFLISPCGAGASLFPELAIQRSIDEVIQCMELYSSEDIAEDRQSLELASNFSQILPCLQPRLEQFEIFNTHNKSDILRLSSPHSSNHDLVPLRSIARQLEIIFTELVDQGYAPLTRAIEENENICVGQVFVPGLERFHLIRAGILVAPQKEFKFRNRGDKQSGDK